MKIIFLDIDGVLNSDKWNSLDYETKNLSPIPNIDPSAVQLLNQLIQKTNAKIVLSSSWRYNWSNIDDVMMQSINLEIYDITPIIVSKFQNYKTSFNSVIEHIDNLSYPTPRGVEIQAWLDMHSNDNIENYVILDDINNMLLSQKNNFILIDSRIGLTQEDVNKAIKILE